ncbi:50S ribosomal protein L3 [Desulfocarbo indianensis]|nr:50S ribosomal protein L3 [Desulfocarbo indianensis]
MLNGIIGKKLGMARLFLGGGQSVPVTLIEAGPCTVVQVKKPERDKYSAVQLGFGAKKAKRVNKPMAGHFAKAGGEPKAALKEFRVEDAGEYEVGQTVTAEIFAQGDKINVVGTSKGRGFTGVVKRHNFAGGKNTHGCTTHDLPGSIGASADPSRVVKGKKMPGQYGNSQVTVRNLKVVDVRPEENLIVVAGAVPGANGGIVYLQKA